MKTRLAILIAVLLLMGVSSVYAGNSLRTGTAGALELQIPVDARGASLGGAVVANTSGVEAMNWNPAGLAQMRGTEAMFTHLKYLADIDVNYGAFATAIEDFGTIGVEAKVVSIGDMEETTQEYPDGTGRVFSPTLAVLGISYARILTANVSFGASGKIIREDIFEAQATGLAFDVGFIYDPGWRGMTFGLAVRNYGSEMSFSGRGFMYDLDDRQASPEGASFDLPSSINLGAAYNFYDKDLHMATFSANFRSNNYYEDLYQGGVEYMYDGKYSLRAGYNYSEDEHWLYGASLGGGLTFNFGGTDITVEYTWWETDVFDSNQFFSAKLHF